VAYATVTELQRVLGIPTPTAAQTDAMNRVLEAAAEKIDWELGYTATSPAPSPPPALVVDVNLKHAVELWQNNPYGQLPVAADAVPTFADRNIWYRHHLSLQSLKTGYGVG